MSRPADDPPPLDFTPVLRFILFLFVLELYEIPRGAGQFFATPLVHPAVIFDSNTTRTCNIHTRFYRNPVSRGKLCFFALGHAGLLGNFQPQPMPLAGHAILFYTVARCY